MSSKPFQSASTTLGKYLIDRLYDPAKFLGMIHERINPGGLLILTSPYTWLEEFTERAKWLGGFKSSMDLAEKAGIGFVDGVFDMLDTVLFGEQRLDLAAR